MASVRSQSSRLISMMGERRAIAAQLTTASSSAYRDAASATASQSETSTCCHEMRSYGSDGHDVKDGSSASSTNPAVRSPPTIIDLAAHVGVSKTTVSRALNGSPRVAPATRARVFEAIEELGFQVNLAARSLRTA